MTTTPDPLQTEVAQIALQAAAGHGFALAGGQALMAHGIVQRPTQDVDLFTDRDGAVRSATALVTGALEAAGFQVELQREESDLGDVIEGLDSEIVDLQVSRSTDHVRLSLARFDRNEVPGMMEVGPVLHLADVIGSKVAALATRAEPRDYIDVSAALDRFTREELLELGRASDPALADDEVADAMVRLDRLADDVWQLQYGLTPQACARIRASFADWPREVD
ncbi:putative nucleotidyltransferase component of viral defense system [Allocatelliglobosispora scoriae]|uniref:Putative nucleotidyltransferase component of viral defense system n=1 Tax=Allocatelliglobosispora scoriae TaxID=643052 RepID=A0A841BLA8_9ACTN|nr:nucleotidyl transferase AbiEii/AbiGii toxin family protein [Allocatelliglobosispora scoriae]MBB5867600.1 putative nucleotidyltransferase component of viral defense system [Allocatelliglobosispora scoriae]